MGIETTLPVDADANAIPKTWRRENSLPGVLVHYNLHLETGLQHPKHHEAGVFVGGHQSLGEADHATKQPARSPHAHA